MNEFKSKKLAEFELKLLKTISEFFPNGDEMPRVNTTRLLAKQFISDLIDEMESNAFLKDIVTKTRIDTLRQVLLTKEWKEMYSEEDWADKDFNLYLINKAKEIWGIELNK